MDVSIIIPAYNEEGNIRKLYSEIDKALKKKAKYELIFIDDGSSDGTFEQMQGLADDNKRIKIIRFSKNLKKSAAYTAGFDHAEGDIIITLDADLQDDPAEIPRFLDAMKSHDMVVGWKHERKDPLSRRMPSKVFNWLNYHFFGVRLHDNDCGFRAMKKTVADSLDLYGDLYRFIPALASQNGYDITEIKVKHRPRVHGKSKYGIKRLITGPLDLITVKFLLEYKERPLHLFGGIGILFFILGFIAELYVLYYKIFLGHAFGEHLPMLILGVLLLVLGVQVFGIGLMGELISSFQSRKKKYAIKDLINF